MKIPGLIILNDVLTDLEQAELVSKINQESWNLDLARRTQHYGYRYDYRAKRLSDQDKLGPLPGWLTDLCKKLNTHLGFSPEQVIVNEYNKGQQITPHIDAPHLFGPTVASLSLCSKADIIFSDKKRGGIRVEIPLSPGSLVVLSGEARINWFHSIEPVSNYRLSVTFRTIV